jgi:GNAT superfamily N-acetyltransferase
MFHVRPATFADRPAIAHHRVSMFVDMGRVPANQSEPLRHAAMAFLADAMPRGEYLGWFATPAAAPSRIAAGVGVQLRNIQSFPTRDLDGYVDVAGGREALVVNVYTEKEFRRLGLARKLMGVVLDWSRQNGIDRLVLHASDEGRPLYEALGFQSTNEMVFKD